jgi:hypothetical protein
VWSWRRWVRSVLSHSCRAPVDTQTYVCMHVQFHLIQGIDYRTHTHTHSHTYTHHTHIHTHTHTYTHTHIHLVIAKAITKLQSMSDLVNVCFLFTRGLDHVSDVWHCDVIVWHFLLFN